MDICFRECLGCKCEINEKSVQDVETFVSVETNGKVIAQENKGIYVNVPGYLK